MYKVITVASGKGGAGKSAACAFLGQAFARLNLRTLIVELDSGLRCLDVMLTLNNSIVYDLKDLLGGRCTPDQAAVEHGKLSNLHIICATQDSSYRLQESAFVQLMRWVRQYYDVVLIDTPAGLREETRISAQNSDLGIIVTTPDLSSVRDGGRASQLMRKYGLEDQRLIINKVPYNLVKRDGLEDLDDVIDGTGVQLLGVLPFSEEISKACALGQALLPTDITARIFDSIAQRLLGKNAELLIS